MVLFGEAAFFMLLTAKLVGRLAAGQKANRLARLRVSIKHPDAHLIVSSLNNTLFQGVLN